MITITKNKKGNLPNLIIIGAQKCATTSLHYYLSLHPEVCMSREKELNFFYGKNWSKGIEWYKSNFTCNAEIYGESSPNYTFFPFIEGVPERVYSIVPKARLLYIIRNPLDRIISHYIHAYSINREPRTIEDSLMQSDNNRYISVSKYYMQIEQYLKYFPRANIMIGTLEDLQSDVREAMREIFKFLDVDSAFYSPKFLNVLHKSSHMRKKNATGLFLKSIAESSIRKFFPTDLRMRVGNFLYKPFSSRIDPPVLSEKTLGKIHDLLIDDINRLREFTGRSFDEWSM